MTESPDFRLPAAALSRRYQSQNSFFHRRRPLFWFTLAFCAGIFLDSRAAFSYRAVACSALAAMAVAALSISVKRTQFAAGLILGLALGLFVHAERFRIPPRNDISELTPARPIFVWLRGVIVEAEWRAAQGDSRDFRSVHWTVAVQALGRERPELSPATGRIRLDVRLDTPPSAGFSIGKTASSKIAEGDFIECFAMVEPLPEATLPDGFDYGAYLAGQGVRRVGSVPLYEVKRLAPPQWWRIDLRLRRYSGELAARTCDLLNGNAEQAGLLNAMVFGRRENLSVSDREAFAISGTAHLIAISGLHVQLICGALYFLLGYFGLSRRRAAFPVLALSAAYCLMTGSAPPAVRAVAMLGSYLAASLFWRDADPLSTLAAAALFVLGLTPQELFSAGFQLSFLAVFALIALRPVFEDACDAWRARMMIGAAPSIEPPGWKDRAAVFVRKSFFITLAAWLATAPVVAWHMGRFSTLSLFVNLAAVPLLSACMFPGIAAIALGAFVPALGKIAGWLAWLALWLLEEINAIGAAIPNSSIDVPRPPVWLLVFYAASLLWIWIERNRAATYKRLAWLVPAVALLLPATVFLRVKPSAPELTIFDLGYGRAALLETPSGAALIDAGHPGQGARLAETLRRRGTRELDLLVLSADEPDAMGGALEVVRRIPPRRVIVPRAKMPSETRRNLERYLSERHIPCASPNMSETPQAPEGVAWEFFDDGPPSDQPAPNQSVLCARVNCGAFKALFVMAESSASLGRLLPKLKTGIEAEVLRVIPSGRSRWPKELPELAGRVKPKLIVAGTNQLPEEITGANFEVLNAGMFAPKREGSIRVTVENGNLKVEAYRGRWRELRPGISQP